MEQVAYGLLNLRLMEPTNRSTLVTWIVEVAGCC